MAEIVTFCNQKGGACKTTSAAAFASCLARRGCRVLLVDTDQQASLSFLVGASAAHPGAFELFTAPRGSIDAAASVQHMPICDIVAADWRLVAAETALMGEIAREQRLAEALGGIRDSYDWILIDTPPAISAVMLNALVAADWLVIPTNASVLHAAGMKKLFETIATVRASCNPRLAVAGVAVTMRRKTRAQAEMSRVLAEIAASAPFDCPVFEAEVPMCAAVEDAQKHGADIFGTRRAAASAAAAAYAAMVDELMARTAA